MISRSMNLFDDLFQFQSRGLDLVLSDSKGFKKITLGDHTNPQ